MANAILSFVLYFYNQQQNNFPYTNALAKTFVNKIFKIEFSTDPRAFNK